MMKRTLALALLFSACTDDINGTAGAAGGTAGMAGTSGTGGTTGSGGNGGTAGSGGMNGTGGSGGTPSGTVYFDGRAKRMTTLYSYETTHDDPNTRVSDQSPAIWDCLCFINNDISLTADGRYGNVYKVAVATGDNNGWPGSINTYDGAGQVSNRQSTDYGKWDYYAIAVKVPSWNGPLSDLFFVDIASLGYETIQGDQVALRLMNDNGVLSYAVGQNSGQLTQNSGGWYAGTVAYNQALLPVVYGQWEEFVIGVKWTADNTGGVVVYARNPAQTSSSWTQVFSKLNEPTYAYGCTNYSCSTISDLQASTATVINKIGLYFQEYGGESETVYESGLTRSSDLATAESTLP